MRRTHASVLALPGEGSEEDRRTLSLCPAGRSATADARDAAVWCAADKAWGLPWAIPGFVACSGRCVSQRWTGMLLTRVQRWQETSPVGPSEARPAAGLPVHGRCGHLRRRLGRGADATPQGSDQQLLQLHTATGCIDGLRAHPCALHC